jgi:hypothetical protein
MRVIAPGFGNTVTTSWEGLSWQARIIAFAVRMAAPGGRMDRPDYVANPDAGEPGFALTNRGADVLPTGTVFSYGPTQVTNDWAWLIYDMGQNFTCTGIRADWQATSAPGHLDIGMIWVGNYYAVSSGFDSNYSRERVDNSRPQITDGGQQYYHLGAEPQRRTRLQLTLQREDQDIITQTSGLLRIRDELDGSAQKRPVLIAPRTDGRISGDLGFVGYADWGPLSHTGGGYWSTSIVHDELV